MKHLFVVSALVALALVVGCTKDEGTTTPTPTPVDPLVANWKSEGQTQVAPGLWGAPFKVRKIAATFSANNTYAVASTDSAGAIVNYTGTWSKTGPNSQNIYSIVLNQSTPTTLTSSGIYRVSNDTLKYEIIQTTPAITGFTAAIADSGFGSTKYLGFRLGATWIQTFIKQ
jgi:hypothetical protein